MAQAEIPLYHKLIPEEIQKLHKLNKKQKFFYFSA